MRSKPRRSRRNNPQKKLPHGTIRIEQSARKLKSLRDSCSTRRRNKKAMSEKKECSLGLSYTKLNSSYTKNYSLLRRGLLQSRLGKNIPAARGGWEEEKLKRAGNAGKGKERKEASARFCAVLWQDLRFCGFG